MADETTKTETPGSEPSIADIIAFDPFAPPKTETKAEGTETSTETTDTTTTEKKPPVSADVKKAGTTGTTETKSAAQQTAPAKPVVPAAPATPVPATKDDLERLIQSQAATIKEALKPQETKETTPQAPKFNLGVPPALVKALRSEDEGEFSSGVGALVNGIANHVWNQFMDHIQQQILPSMPHIVEGYIQTVTQQQRVATDFYGKYPQLQTDVLKPMIQQVGAQIANERASAGKPLAWGEELRDEIAERVFTHLPQLRTVAAAPTGNGTKPPVQKQPFSAGTGSRPPVVADNTLNEMLGVLGIKPN